MDNGRKCVIMHQFSRGDNVESSIRLACILATNLGSLGICMYIRFGFGYIFFLHAIGIVPKEIYRCSSDYEYSSILYMINVER